MNTSLNAMEICQFDGNVLGFKSIEEYVHQCIHNVNTGPCCSQAVHLQNYVIYKLCFSRLCRLQAVPGLRICCLQTVPELHTYVCCLQAVPELRMLFTSCT